MSAGAFVLGFYTSDALETHNIKYQPESAVLSIDGSPNTIPGGPATTPEWVKATKGNKEYGLRTRKVGLRWTGAPPDGYQPGATVYVTIFDPAIFATAPIGASCTYLGTSCTLRVKVPEQRFPTA